MSSTQTITSSNQNPSSQITEHFDADGGGGALLIRMTTVDDGGGDPQTKNSLTKKGEDDDDDDDGGGDELSSLICHGGGGDSETVVIVSRGGDEGIVKGWDGVALLGQHHRQNMSLLQVQQQAYADVCRICHCGPNTLATPTPTVLTPVTSPKKFNNNATTTNSTTQSPTTIHQVSIQLKSQLTTSSQDCQQDNPAPSPIPPPPPPPTIITHQPPSSPKKKKPQGAPPPTPDYNLISPCICSGSLKYVHQCCLQHWIRASNNTSCELCKYPYELRSKFKPLWNWESLPMSSREKKRVVCSALFHTVALACVVWSLYVLIDRTIEELTHSDLEWQFWTKIIVEAIGCLGAGILTYVWGKSYVGLFVKWISFNRSFVILGKEHRNSIPSNQPIPHHPPDPPPPPTETHQQQKETETQQHPANPAQQLPGTSAAGQSQSTELNTAYYKQL